MKANGTAVVPFGLRAMFYAILPSESQFQRVDQVPDYVEQATLFFLLFIFLEYVYGQWIREKKGQRFFRMNAGLSSVSAGLLMRTAHILMKNWEIHSYVWVHDHFRLVQLPWDSAWTWWACFLGVDLMYYWFHRMAHEVNFMWAAHQAHHSSEDYNLATSLRQSIVQQCSSWMFYLPLALFIPSPMFVAHIQFNLLYQFWIHTEVIGKLGPLEWVLNTASHHRVHHGRNRYCIDKNYAGTLIIWDRLFGTFEPEGEQVVYGLTHTLESFDPVTIQACHFRYMFDLLRKSESWSERFSILFKGPGWSPGKTRLGDPADIPDVHAPVQKYDPHVPKWSEAYMFVHFLVTVLCFQELYAKQHVFSCFVVTAFTLYILLTLTAIGATLDKKTYAPYLHASSHLVFLVGQQFVNRSTSTDPPTKALVLGILQFYAIVSFLFWIATCLFGPGKHKQKAK